MEQPKINEIVKVENSYSQFVVEPLERGYGITIGNSLRRILFTKLKGAAIVGVKIDGVQHEFTSLPGVKEDVCEINLNLKDVAVKLFNAESFECGKRISFEMEGPKEFKAGDIQEDGDFEIMNKDLHICTLEDGVKVNMTLIIGSGEGYVEAGANKEKFGNGEVGFIGIDSIFSPVVSAAYSVEAARIGNDLNYDKLILDVKTKATSTPKEVVGLAAQIMIEHLKLFTEEYAGPKNLFAKDEVETVVVDKNLEKECRSFLNLTNRTTNGLNKINVYKMGDLLKKTINEIRNIPSIGEKSVDEIVTKLREKGYHLLGSDEE